MDSERLAKQGFKAAATAAAWGAVAFACATTNEPQVAWAFLLSYWAMEPIWMER